MDALIRRGEPRHANTGASPANPRRRAPLRWARGIAVAVALLFATPAVAQQKPVMENVFYNVVWGSATGALLGAAAAVIASKDKTNPTDMRGAAFQGATAGGIIGFGVGVWLVFAGINFDSQGSTITDATPMPGLLDDRSYALSQLPTPLITFETSPNRPSQISGFRALVVNLKF